MTKRKVFNQVADFDTMPNTAVITLSAAVAISGSSRATLYRYAKAGRLTLVKVGFSTRIRVGELRTLIGVS